MWLSFLTLPGMLTVVSTGPTPVHATSKKTWWDPPRLSPAIPDPDAVTLFEVVLVMVVGLGLEAHNSPPG
jgi:hypothetical protein